MKRQEFQELVYRKVSMIPYGKVATYKQIAWMLGLPQNARQVGQALHNAPDYMQLPCHRVVNGQGRLVPGWQEQRRLLLSEGVLFKENGHVDLIKNVWRFDKNEFES